MRIHNVHERILPVPSEPAGRLLDGLGGRPDPLWPTEDWPPMRFDRPLQVGADGGHGPIRYRVEEHEPGSRVRFRFTGPPGLQGFHEFAVTEAPGGCALCHAIEGRSAGAMLLAWPLFYRPLHDALIEDALDQAERTLTGTVARPRSWSWWVRFLRRLGRRKG
ncbi:MAG: SRPBCC family protein [Actinomycetota bacterium]